MNNEDAYKKSKETIKSLKLPINFEIEFLAMRNNVSMMASYNKAMQMTNAKYKVFMYQEVCIIHKNFIVDMIKIFQLNKEIGIAGVVGSKYLPENGIWQESQECLGAIYNDHFGSMQGIKYKGNERLYTEAVALDGMLLATQYDVLWREDIFSDGNFSGASQSLEFRRKKYKCIVWGQRMPWCIHFCGKTDISRYDTEHVKFLKEYKYEIKPLVSIMIPTYNRPEYFKIALDSACVQTYENIEIIVCDNSTDDNTQNLMESYKNDSRVRYFRNKEAKTKQENFHFFKDAARGEFFQWLMDDDVLEADKIKKMMMGFQENPDITLATSNRRWIDDDGKTVKNASEFNFGDNVEYVIVEGKKMGKQMLLNISNAIGEPSAVLFRKKDLENHYWNADCRGYETISDVVMWLELLKKGNCLYFQHALSSYRRHKQQEGQQFDIVVKSRLEWIYILKEEYAQGYFIENEKEHKIGLKKLLDDAENSILPALKLKKDNNIANCYKKEIENLRGYIGF